MILLFPIAFLLVVGVLVIAVWLSQVRAASGSARQDPPGLGPTQLLPPTVQWRRPWWVPPAITEANSMLYMGLAIVAMLSNLAVIAMFILQGSARALGGFPCGMVGLLLLALQGSLFVKGMLDWQKDQALTNRGELVEGVLFDRWVRRRRGRVDCVAYYFEPPGYSGVIRAEINPEAFRTLRVGDAVQVRYLPDQPQVCRLEI